jgi:hypothetical protein
MLPYTATIVCFVGQPVHARITCFNGQKEYIFIVNLIEGINVNTID